MDLNKFYSLEKIGWSVYEEKNTHFPYFLYLLEGDQVENLAEYEIKQEILYGYKEKMKLAVPLFFS